MTALVWLTRDLRVHDHPALRAALERHERVVPVFCFEDRLLHGRHASGPRTQFLLECLADLDAALRERGGGLVVRRGPAERELARLAARGRAPSEVHFSADVGPFARRRIEAVRSRCAPEASRRWRTRACARWTTSPRCAPRRASRTRCSRRSTVAGSRQPRREVIGRAAQASRAAVRAREGPTARRSASLGLEQEVEEPPRGGEAAARERLVALPRRTT